MKLLTNVENLVKIGPRDTPYGAFICRNISKSFSFVAPDPRTAPIGVKFGVEKSTPNFTPIGATYRPCGAKNLVQNRPLSNRNTFAMRSAQCCQ